MEDTNFNINNLAFEIHESYLAGKLTEEFYTAWRKEWENVGTVRSTPKSISGLTILGDTFIYKRMDHITVNGKILYQYNRNIGG